MFPSVAAINLFVHLAFLCNCFQISATDFSLEPNLKQFVFLQARFPDAELEKAVLVSFQSVYIYIQTDKTLYTPNSKGDPKLLRIDNISRSDHWTAGCEDTVSCFQFITGCLPWRHTCSPWKKTTKRILPWPFRFWCCVLFLSTNLCLLWNFVSSFQSFIWWQASCRGQFEQLTSN